MQDPNSEKDQEICGSEKPRVCSWRVQDGPGPFVTPSRRKVMLFCSPYLGSPVFAASSPDFEPQARSIFLTLHHPLQAPAFLEVVPLPGLCGSCGLEG